jgi:Z1 domain-containing protein
MSYFATLSQGPEMATIEILRTVRPELRWTPEAGEQTLRFRERKCAEIDATEEVDGVILEAQTILGRCVPPSAPGGGETGLVVGYVQSGKTLSFTAVMALARDNGYRLVIVIAGIGVDLKSQSERRVLADLGLSDGQRAWAHFENPDTRSDDVRNIANVLNMWTKANVPPPRRRAVLITVLKNHVRLKNLVATLSKLNLTGVPALVIDDEADQASLNNKAASNIRTGATAKSPTYDWITQIKAVLPHHTFLQYTATPQAPVLVQLADLLSPSFAELVTPGQAYVGGKTFFERNASLARVIPIRDLPGPSNMLRGAPASLQQALRLYLIGAAVHYVRNERGNRSMMVHPSQATGPHADYKGWVDSSLKGWESLLSQPNTSKVFRACAALFQKDYDDLTVTAGSLPPFDDLMNVMALVISETRVLQVNSTRQGEKRVKWKEYDYWVLVGGQKLDRGFTVEGLTVTYMPRPLGTGRADTVQQRARFFGYKKTYQGLCRVFLESDVKDAMSEYVEHEEYVRGALSAFRGQPLRNWKRDFLLTRMLSPTRPSVVGIDTRQIVLDEGWYSPQRLHEADPLITKDNLDVFVDVIRDWTKTYGAHDAATNPRFKDNRTSSPRNSLITGVRLASVLEDLLTRLRIADAADNAEYIALALAFRERLKKFPIQLCAVFVIGDMSPQRRSLGQAGAINQVFMGKSPNVDDLSKLVYVGDAALHTHGEIALQLRAFNIRKTKTSRPFALNVPWLSLYIPQEIAKDVVVQGRGRRV